MTLSSAAWGDIAAQDRALGPRSFWRRPGAIVAIPLTWRWTLQQGASARPFAFSPLGRAAAPHEEIDNDRGPVLVKIEYRIDPKDRTAFLRALDELGVRASARRRVRLGNFRGRRRVRSLRGDLSDRVVARAHAFARAGHQRRPAARGRNPGDADRPAAHRIPDRRRAGRARSRRRRRSRPERETLRILVVYAHPLETSFVSALHARVVETLRAGGHSVDDLDLHAEKFDPVMSREQMLRLRRHERQHARSRTVR